MIAADSAVHAMVDRIVVRFRPRRVILFGPRARGTATASSDVDLLVVFDELPSTRQAAIEVRRALADLPLAKDIVVTTTDEIARRGKMVGSILRTALSEGSIIYERA